jgi:hypothetical protein
MEKFTDIIEQIKKQKTIEPRQSLTDNVMGRLPDKYPGIGFTAVFFTHNLFTRAFAPDGDQCDGLTCRECSFYFFITGIFYLIIGIILMMALREAGSNTALTEWVKMQPYFTTGAAIWLLALGTVLMMDESIGSKIAKYGTLLYIFCAVVNSILLRPYLRIPYSGFFVIALAATSALMGIMLVQAVQKMELRTQ